MQQLRDRLVNQAIKEYCTLKYLHSQLAREERNLLTFEESFERMQERYYNGKATSLDITRYPDGTAQCQRSRE